MLSDSSLCRVRGFCPLIGQPVLRISAADLDNLMSALEVRFVALSECLVSAGHLLELGGIHAPGIHYNVAGKGRIFICDDPPIDLLPHTLIIVPSNRPFRIEVAGQRGIREALKSVDGREQTTTKDGVRRF